MPEIKLAEEIYLQNINKLNENYFIEKQPLYKID